jgi:hypothetical protein
LTGTLEAMETGPGLELALTVVAMCNRPSVLMLFQQPEHPVPAPVAIAEPAMYDSTHGPGPVTAEDYTPRNWNAAGSHMDSFLVEQCLTCTAPIWLPFHIEQTKTEQGPVDTTVNDPLTGQV